MHHHHSCKGTDLEENEENVKRIEMFISVTSSNIAVQYRSRQIAKPQKSKRRERYAEGCIKMTKKATYHLNANPS